MGNHSLGNGVTLLDGRANNISCSRLNSPSLRTHTHADPLIIMLLKTHCSYILYNYSENSGRQKTVEISTQIPVMANFTILGEFNLRLN